MLYFLHMSNRRKPKRYFNIRIDEETYKLIQKNKGKKITIVEYMGNIMRAVHVLGQTTDFAEKI